MSKRPFSTSTTLLQFGLPTLGLFGVYYWLMPALIRAGIRPFFAYAYAFIPLFTALIIAAFVGYYLEGNRLAWQPFAERFRLRRMTRQDWLWTIGGFLLALALFFLLQPLSAWLIRAGWMPVPTNLPAFLDPSQAVTAVLYDEAVGGVEGNWHFLLISLLLLVLNVLGEELWWRGYILPRQEITFGKMTWWVHGLMWTLFHAALWWNLLNLLPLSVGLAFVATRRKSSSVGLVTHILHKTDFFIVTLPLFWFGIT